MNTSAKLSLPITKTCGECTHFKLRRFSEPGAIDGKCLLFGLLRDWADKSCPKFNAPSGLQWILWNGGWQLFINGYHMGNIASLNWYRTQPDRELIHRDARALVAAVKWGK